MNEFRLDPETMNFTLVSEAKLDCPACRKDIKPIAAADFKSDYIRVYEIKDSVQPSKFELSGELLKSSKADGYNEIIVDSKEHGDPFSSYSAEDVENLLMFVSSRVKSMDKYSFGKNIEISRYLRGHGFFDLVILDIPNYDKSKCIECAYVANTGSREAYRTEHFVAYTPFAPRTGLILSVSPLKHIQITDIDPVTAFDLAGLIKKVINALGDDVTMTIHQPGNGHFSVRFYAGERNPFSLLGINKISLAPEELAKEIGEKLKNETEH